MLNRLFLYFFKNRYK